jgi:hypothetical protein
MQFYEKIKGRKVVMEYVPGINQLAGYNAGLKYALDHGYDLCVGTDDDCTFEQSWFRRGRKYMHSDPDCGVLFGYCLLSFQSLEEQTCSLEYALNEPEYQGRLKEMLFYHCSVLDPRMIYKNIEQGYGPFYFRPKDAQAVHGLPSYLSPLGFRGEAILQDSIRRLGKKLILDPEMWCWHHSASFGGLRLVQGETRRLALEHDLKIWNAILARGTPSTARPEGV